MTIFVPVDLWHVRTGEWLAHIPMFDAEVTGTSHANIEEAAYAKIEQAYGLRAFTIIWRNH